MHAYKITVNERGYSKERYKFAFLPVDDCCTKFCKRKSVLFLFVNQKDIFFICFVSSLLSSYNPNYLTASLWDITTCLILTGGYCSFWTVHLECVDLCIFICLDLLLLKACFSGVEEDLRSLEFSWNKCECAYCWKGSCVK